MHRTKPWRAALAWTAEGGCPYADSLRLHQPARGNADVVAGRVLHHIHHLVGLADDIVRRPGIVRKSRQSHTGAKVQVQAQLGAENARAYRSEERRVGEE